MSLEKIPHSSTWTASKGNILITASGSMKEELFNKYKAALDTLK